jgi:hypothetical protein
MKHPWIAAILLAASCGPAGAQAGLSIVEYSGMCDASAAVALDKDIFIVASDEDNILRIYHRGEPAATQSIPLDAFLEVDPNHPEADLEGATRIGDTIYWISSHGQNKDGKERPNRHRLFATTVAIEGGKIKITPSGNPYRNLRSDLIAAPQLAKFKLDAAAARALESKDGFNLEGLAAAPDGRLMVGFRNPLKKGKALIVAIDNPQEVIKGRQAQIGAAAELDLDHRGIRSIEWDEARNRYLIVAGPYNDDGTFALYAWSGKPGDAAAKVPGIDFGKLNPEAMFFEPGDPTRAQILSDDGGLKIDGTECKKFAPDHQHFRGTTLTLP